LLWSPYVIGQTIIFANLPKLVSIGLFCRPLAAKPPIFAVFWTSAFSGVANWQQYEKVEHGCTTINLPLSNGIKIVTVLQRLHGEIGRTNSYVQKRDGQTKKETQRLWPTRREIRAPPNLAW